MILITKGGLSRGGDNEMPENCLYDCRLRDTCIYVPRWADEETLLRIGTERSKSCPLVQVYEVPKETGQAHTVMYDHKTEPTISKMEQVDKDINVRSNDEPQTDIHDLTDCDFCKDRNCKDCEGGKDEPQTICKMPYEDCEDCETHLKAQYGDCNKCKWYGDKQVCGICRSKHLYVPKDEPQTDCAWK